MVAKLQNLPWVGNTSVGLEKQVWDVDTVWIMVLTEAKAGRCSEPRDKLVTSATLNLVSSRHKF